MKLELRHITPYLPYGLRCEILNCQCDYVGERYGVINGYYDLDNEPHYRFGSLGNAGKDASLIKPILRPMADLTKEIEVNGEKFVPIKKIMEIRGYDLESIYDMEFDINGYGIFLKDNDPDEPHFLLNPNNPNTIEYFIIKLMFEWHFDISNLIEAGLAMDINNVKEKLCLE